MKQESPRLENTTPIEEKTTRSLLDHLTRLKPTRLVIFTSVFYPACYFRSVSFFYNRQLIRAMPPC